VSIEIEAEEDEEEEVVVEEALAIPGFASALGGLSRAAPKEPEPEEEEEVEVVASLQPSFSFGSFFAKPSPLAQVRPATRGAERVHAAAVALLEAHWFLHKQAAT
jgi:hypothetical protein